jgi:hypothetical protein
MDYMNEELVRLYFQSEAREVASSRRTRCQRSNFERNHKGT